VLQLSTGRGTSTVAAFHFCGRGGGHEEEDDKAVVFRQEDQNRGRTVHV
jgi:hypothetical protein